MPIRLVMVSPEAILLYGLAHVFGSEPDLEVSTLRMSPREAVAALPATGVDVLLLDVELGDRADMAALEELSARRPETAVVVLVGAVNPEELIETLALGVRGVLVKAMAPRLFVECVRKVARGERWVELRAESLALERMVRREAVMRQLSRQFTARELEIVPLVAVGLSNKEVGARLGISHSTVKVHLKNVFRKLGVRGRVQLVRWAEEHGLRRPGRG